MVIIELTRGPGVRAGHYTGLEMIALIGSYTECTLCQVLFRTFSRY